MMCNNLTISRLPRMSPFPRFLRSVETRFINNFVVSRPRTRPLIVIRFPLPGEDEWDGDVDMQIPGEANREERRRGEWNLRCKMESSFVNNYD